MKKLNILIVEDHAQFAEVLKILCGRHGDHKILHAGDLSQAREFIASGFSPDLVFSDFSLPDGKGPSLFELYRTSKKDAGTVHIVLSSGEHVGSQNHGADEFIHKGGMIAPYKAVLDKISKE